MSFDLQHAMKRKNKIKIVSIINKHVLSARKHCNSQVLSMKYFWAKGLSNFSVHRIYL